MRQLVVETPDFKWISLIDPSQKEFEQLSSEFNLSMGLLEVCLDRTHLPKYEMRDQWHFAILRSHDFEAPEEADSIQELTRKIAVFYDGKVLVTIQRQDRETFSKMRAKWTEGPLPHMKNPAGRILADLFLLVVESYKIAIEGALEKIEEFETKIFLGSNVPQILEELYYLKRKSSIYRRMLRIHGDLFKQAVVELKFSVAKNASIRDEVDRVFFHAETLQESAMHLFNVHVSISSQRTNDVMRVLTVFSVFFMPLTFIVGVYGMNFKYMPELEHPSGYLFVWGGMLFTVLIHSILVSSRLRMKKMKQPPP